MIRDEHYQTGAGRLGGSGTVILNNDEVLSINLLMLLRGVPGAEFQE